MITASHGVQDAGPAAPPVTAAGPLHFELQRTSGQARRGILRTLHGPIETPVFMPVGTLGAVRGLDADDMRTLQTRIMLCNAYHLMLRPTDARVAALGGLHRFIGYDGALLCDSGGYQVYSLARTRHIEDDGVTFRSHVDGAQVHLTPERLVEVQENLRPDIAMVLDECPPAQAPRAAVQHAMRRTTAWAQRALAARHDAQISWFGIVQGALFEDLRAEHAQALSSLPFAGYAIGGVSVGEATDDLARIVAYTTPLLPVDRPRYLMGVGTPDDLVRGVAAGVDMFDCVMPARNARNGTLFVAGGRLSIKGAQYKDDARPLCPSCMCAVCRRYSRAFLRHLFVTHELSYYRLATLHNLAFYHDLMARMRAAIAADAFDPKSFLSPGAML